jgi:hypothetical protein
MRAKTTSAKVVAAVTAPAATSLVAMAEVNPVAKVAQKAVADALKPVKLRVAVVPAVAVVDAAVALTAQRKAKASAIVLTMRAVLWTPANRH